jgi:hypothetical protein
VGSGRAFRSLTLLFAVCEQVLEELESAPVSDEETRAAVTALRDRLAVVLPRFGRRPTA